MRIEQNSSLKMLQLYSWIKNEINTAVKRNTSKTQIKGQEKIQKTPKHTQNTLIITFKHKGATEMTDNFSNRT